MVIEEPSSMIGATAYSAVSIANDKGLSNNKRHPH